MKNTIKSCLVTLCLLSLSIFSSSILATTKKVAKVVMLKGKARHTVNKKYQYLSKGDWINEGAYVATESKSVLKLRYINASQVVLGPTSKMKITSFKKNRVKIISFIKGSLRVKVDKGMQAEKLKMIVRTKTAAMGVRGTDFQVTYNDKNKNTGVLSFGGVVSITNDRTAKREVLTQKLLQNKGVVLPGRFAQASPKLSATTIPVKISTSQFELLKSNRGSLGNSATKVSKKFKSPFPPGIEVKSLNKQSVDLSKQVAGAVGKKNFNKVLSAIKTESQNQIKVETAPPEGIFDKKNNKFAPASGGFLDVKTGLYVAPPAGSSYDPNTQTYIPPKTLGSVDPKTGEYVAPAGYQLKSDGKFEVVNEDLAKSSGPPPVQAVGSVTVIEKGGKMAKVNERVKKILIKHGYPPQKDPWDSPFSPPKPTLNELLSGTDVTIKFQVID